MSGLIGLRETLYWQKMWLVFGFTYLNLTHFSEGIKGVVYSKIVI